MINDRYAEIAPFYDLEFDAFDADVDLYLGYAQIVDGPVLELGSGTGRLLKPLADAGFQVTGLDSSDSMTRIATDRLADQVTGGSVQLIHGDMRDLSSFALDTFRLVIVAVNSFLHLESSEDQLAVLGQIRNVIDRDGLLVIDVFNPTPGALIRMEDRYAFDATWTLSTGETVQRYSLRQLDCAAQLITTQLFYDVIASNGSVSRRMTSYQMRYVHRFELEHLITGAGFEIEGVYGSYALDPLEHESDNLIIVAHRTANPGED